VKRWIIFSIIALAIFSVDIATKELIEKNIPYLGEIKITDFFNIVHVQNRGSIFGIFSGIKSQAFRIFMNILSLSVLVVLIVSARMFSGFTFYVIAAMIGGAAGNVYERLTKGYVVDFLDFHIGGYHWPAFNVADSTITVGIIAIILHSLKSKKT